MSSANASRSCYSFALGQCSYGAHCRFSHDTTEQCPFKSKPKGCRRPDICPFVHTGSRTSSGHVSAHSARSATPTQSTNPRDPQIEAISRRWGKLIPRHLDEESMVDLQSKKLQSFFATALDLVERGDAETRQHVIQKLASECGLAMVEPLANLVASGTTDSDTALAFQTHTLPFFRIITYPAITSSYIIENQVNTIYNFLFGPGGRRAVELFNHVSTIILEMIEPASASHEATFSLAITCSLSVLQCLIEGHSSAQVMEEFRPIVQNFSACLSDDIDLGRAKDSLDRIRKCLDRGSSIPARIQSRTISNVQNAAFQLAVDLPGDLSPQGPRHDNDHKRISDIQILPTSAEIMSQRQEYLPSSKATAQHLSGMSGLLDRHFRLLREDTVGQVRDAVRVELTHLQHPNRHAQQNVRKDVRRNVVHHNVRFLKLLVVKRKGLQILVGFDQPQVIHGKSQKNREEYWQHSKRLQADSFVCFVSASGRIIFFSVCDLPRVAKKAPALGDGALQETTDNSEDSPSLSRNGHMATVLLSMVEHSEEDLRWIVHHLGTHQCLGQSLVEFPGILLPSFQPTLKALQKMSLSLDMPFADIIAPEIGPLGLHATQTSDQPPEYARTAGFRFNLESLTGGDTLSLKPRSEETFDFETFKKHTTLDDAQQEAVIHALQSPLAAIQGPPGTGKSYTGVSIIKVLLQNREAGTLGPIICVCYTNHALDQLLEHLWRDEVRQIIRLGSRSKSEILQKLGLRNVSKDIESTKLENHEKWAYNQKITTLLTAIEPAVSAINEQSSGSAFRDHLRENYQKRFHELFEDIVDEDGFTEVKRDNKNRTIESWLRSAPENSTSDLSIDDLDTVSLNHMSAKERIKLHESWLESYSDEHLEDLIGDLDDLHDAESDLNNCYQELDLRCLQQANIIGVTTSGLARNIDLLGRVGAKVVICEEAGEVLEAHTLTTFLPSVQHAILIGDHEQLRPQINNYELQHDNPRGEKYSLDISMFERLVNPKPGNPGIPCISLETQRRMHPSISELIRVPLYPNLKDHPSVIEHPEVEGMRDRLFWLDHREKEDKSTSQSVSMSRTNTHEVNMVEALVTHLVSQGKYAIEDIAVLTPYLGQLIQIRQRLSRSFAIVVGDRDCEEIEAHGLADTQQPPQVSKTTLLNALRVATVDNFQGEEAKVVVISLVRSNDERNCGFLKTSNRINVLLSRARDGMYIIGNSETARPVTMWSQVISLLERSGNIGTSLALCCPRHKDTPINVSNPDDFARLSPEGGCNKKCVSRLRCGHACIKMCHSDALHNAVHCPERCQRVKAGCDHACPKVCGDQCDDKCQAPVKDVTLSCGHVAQQVKCFEAQAPEIVKCQVLVEQTMPHCGHRIMVPCHRLPIATNHGCTAKCGILLPCGHACNSYCYDCRPKPNGMESDPEPQHPPCKTTCGRPYTTCGHSCETACHGDLPCSLCCQPCDISCSHSKCSKKCSEPCAPCAEDCSWSCPHAGKCPLPCAVPCNLLPCSKRCTNSLSCGHQCPSICGETCPDARFCQQCAKEPIRTMMVDYIMSYTYEEVDLDENPCIFPSCGHILTLESMDGQMSMPDFYTSDASGSITGLVATSEPFSASAMKSCPLCRGPLRNINRYSRLVRRALIDESTKKFIIWANAGFIQLVKRMQTREAFLLSGAQHALVAAMKSSRSIELTGSREMQAARIDVLTRGIKECRPLLNLRREIKSFLGKVDENEQPFGRIRDLMIDAKRHRGLEVDHRAEFYNADILQTRNRLLTTVLLIRCDYAILFNFLESYKKASVVTSRIKLDFDSNRQDCETLILEAEARKQPGSIVEGRLFWVRFLVLERSFSDSSDRMKALGIVAGEHLEEAREICASNPGQTQGMIGEIEDVETMLRDSTFYMTVTNEEKAAVYAAMASDFQGTGHWYYCINGHPFTVGECGMPMQTSVCPQCGEPVGGSNHNNVDGVRRANDLEEAFGGLSVQ